MHLHADFCGMRDAYLRILSIPILTERRGRKMTRVTKTSKILMLNPYGRYLGYSGMNFIVRDKSRTTEKQIPFHSVGQIILQSGHAVSTGALVSAGFWNIDVMILSASGKPVAIIKALDDFSHVKTRLCQYEAYKNRKGVEIAKALIIGKVEAQSQILRKYNLEGFETLDIPRKEEIKLLYAENVDKIRNKLHGIEAKYSQHYFQQIISLFPKYLRKDWKKRQGYKAYDELNNLFNFCHEYLKWKIFPALIKAKLEPFLGYLHKTFENRPSLVCDFQEIYRCLIDNFLIQYSQKLKSKDFEKCYERGYYNKKVPRKYLRHTEINNLIKSLDKYFEIKVEIPRIRRGKKSSIETVIKNEASLLAQFIRGEKKDMWIPRILIP